jgi:hypothetical protein
MGWPNDPCPFLGQFLNWIWELCMFFFFFNFFFVMSLYFALAIGFTTFLIYPRWLSKKKKNKEKDKQSHDFCRSHYLESKRLNFIRSLVFLYFSPLRSYNGTSRIPVLKYDVIFWNEKRGFSRKKHQFSWRSRY